MASVSPTNAWVSQDNDTRLKAVIRKTQTSTGFKFISTRALSERFSGHGVPRTVGNVHPLRKLCWLAVTTVFSIFMIWQCYKVINEYSNYKKVTLVGMYEAVTPTFPAVTICNQNSLNILKIRDRFAEMRKMDRNAAQDLLVKLHRMDEAMRNVEKCNMTSSDAYKFVKYYLENDQEDMIDACDLEHLSEWGDEDPQMSAQEEQCWNFDREEETDIDENYLDEYDIEDYYYPDFSGADSDDVLELLKRSQSNDLSDFQSWIAVSADKHKAFGYDIFELIKSCTFNGENCNPHKDFYLSTNEKYGNCFTFNSKLNRRGKLKVTSKYGSKHGLKITLDSLSHTYLNILSPDIGFRLSVHDPSVVSFPEDVGIDVPRNHKVSIAVSMTHLERLGPPYGSCSDKDWKYIGGYSAFGCRKICFDERVEQKCGCKTTIQDLVKSKRPKRIKLCDITNKTQLDCKIQVQKEFSSNNNRPCGECTDPCSETKYSFDLSTSNRNNEFQSARKMALLFRERKKCDNESSDISSLNFKNPDLVDIHIYLKSKSVEKISEKPAYTWDTLVSNLGGITGLCLGLSMITVVEVLEYLLDLLIYLLGFHNPKERHIEEVTIEFPSYNIPCDTKNAADVFWTEKQEEK